MANVYVTSLDGEWSDKKTLKYEIRDKGDSFFALMGNSLPLDNTNDLEYSVIFMSNRASLYSNQAVCLGKLTFMGR